MKKVIYKYFRVNQYLYDTLISNQLYFSSIKQFNDPYDCHLALFEDISEEDFKTYLDYTFSEEAREKYLAAFKKKPKEFVQPFIDMYKGILNYYGICCFTKAKDNILLWSHYSDSHKGVCLGFDYDKMTKKFPQFDEVEYADTPFYFNLKNPSESVAKTVLRKSKDWYYEQEIRFLMERSKSIDFYQDALLEVNFGAKCNKRDVMNIQYLISKLNYPNCKFYNADINQKKYIVEFSYSDINVLKKEVLEDSKEIRYSKTVNLEHLL